MNHDVRIGAFEELVLLAVAGLGRDAYAVLVQQHLESQAQRSAAMGAIYTALDRLEKKGYLRSHLGEVTQKRGGKRKRLYQITGAGVEALYAMRTMREHLWTQARPNLGFSG